MALNTIERGINIFSPISAVTRNLPAEKDTLIRSLEISPGRKTEEEAEGTEPNPG
jgi:hypothetical protein